MKYLILLLFLASGFIAVKAQSIKLPLQCKKILDKKFQGWKLGKTPKDVTDYHKTNKSPFEPYLVKGDWNGDGKVDYAILIEHLKKARTIAFVRSQKKYEYYSLEGGDYIQVFKKGEKDYDYTSDKDFTYQNDSIFVGVGECCGTSFVWRKGKFVGLITSD
ncbi:MAG TPA: hypothetical protein VF556_14745 [Pyrinomonadaceae bacterium]|jgi:hypothetical protein